MSQENNKTKQLLLYLLDRNSAMSVTCLMKLCYLADLINIKENSNQISNFEYKRYYFGPFDQKIYLLIDELIHESKIKAQVKYATSGQEFMEYELQQDVELKENFLEKEEELVVSKLLDNVKGYGARILTEIAYKTKPMKELGATLGGDENLNKKLNLKA